MRHRLAPHPAPRVLRALALILLPLLATGGFPTGCEKGSNIQDVRVDNEPGHFTLHFVGMDNFTRTVTYSWENPESTATVEQRSIIEDGAGLVEIKDAVGLLIHAKNLREHGTFMTFPGAPGTWKVTVVLDEATGGATLDLLSTAP